MKIDKYEEARTEGLRDGIRITATVTLLILAVMSAIVGPVEWYLFLIMGTSWWIFHLIFGALEKKRKKMLEAK